MAAPHAASKRNGLGPCPYLLPAITSQALVIYLFSLCLKDSRFFFEPRCAQLLGPAFVRCNVGFLFFDMALGFGGCRAANAQAKTFPCCAIAAPSSSSAEASILVLEDPLVNNDVLGISTRCPCDATTLQGRAHAVHPLLYALQYEPTRSRRT